MKAAVLNAFASPLAIETVADPVLGTGEVIVDVAASRVLAYANEVLSGERNYLLELPVVFGPGAIGRIRATGPDATRLRVGDWRIIFYVERNTLVVVAVGHRRDVRRARAVPHRLGRSFAAPDQEPDRGLCRDCGQAHGDDQRL